ncbi:MAG: hypothetical protein OHK0017_11660 [Patescibacteria group bacterium]
MSKLKKIIKGILGPSWKILGPWYHGLRGLLAAVWFGFPAKKLYTIGITGTKGKTSTSIQLGRILNLAGCKTGYISSALINLGDFNSDQFVSAQTCSGEIINDQKMSTLDPWTTQKYLRQMVENDCEYVVLEMSSQGLESKRHWGIFGFDATMFLNMFPEHLDAHGGWENYRYAKSILFRNMRRPGLVIMNAEANEMQYMLAAVNQPEAHTYLIQPEEDFKIIGDPSEVEKKVILEGEIVSTNFTADFEVFNLSMAYLSAKQILEEEILVELVSQLKGVPGRMEWVVKAGELVFKN